MFQDTVVALQALSKYAALAYGSDMDLTVTAQATNFHEVFSVAVANSLVLQTETVSVPTIVTLTAAGDGCAFVQVFLALGVYSI